MITDQDAAAPPTPSTAGGLKDKRNIISVILKRIFNRKYFKVKFLLYCPLKYTALSYIAFPFLLHGISQNCTSEGVKADALDTQQSH